MHQALGWLASLWMLFSNAAFAGSSLLFGINEGTSSSLDAMFRHEKYAALSAYLSKAVGKPLKTETSNILPILIRSLEKTKYDVLLVRPSHISAHAMRDYGYRLLVTAKGESKVHFIVRADSPLKSLADVRGRIIAFPEEMAYPTQLGKALLRETGIDPSREKLLSMDRQEAVGYAVKEKMADVGVVISYSKVAKEWQAKGDRFLHTRDGLPFWSIIVSSKVTDTTAARLRDALLGLENSPRGQAILKEIGIAGFVVGDQKAYLDMLSWVEGGKSPR